MEIKVLKSVVVVTPTVGSPKLSDAIQSVMDQTYKNTQHLLVIDGAEFFDKVTPLIPWFGMNGKVLTLPFNVGANGFYGHRVYAAIGHLLNCDYVAFLDEDNWYDPDHIETLVKCMDENPESEFVYSYRKVWTPDKTEHMEDNCESLGMWPVWVSDQSQKLMPHTHVDTSSYLFKRSFLINHGHIWHSGWGADRRFFQIATQQLRVKNYSTFNHTLNYRLDGNKGSVNLDFFKQGNKKMLEYYDGEYPWKE